MYQPVREADEAILSCILFSFRGGTVVDPGYYAVIIKSLIYLLPFISYCIDFPH